MKDLKQNLTYYISIFLSLLIIFSASIYRVYSLNNLGILISLLLTIIIFIILLNMLIANKNRDNRLKIIHTEQIKKYIPKNFFLKIIPFFYILIVSVLFIILYKLRTDVALISPWEVIPSFFYFLYFFSLILLIIYSIYSKPKLIFYTLHFFLSFSIAFFIYKIGYGFDSFIHQATEDLISKTGSVDPKPFYYLGQYGLVVILHKISCIPIFLADKLLAPFLASLLLPYTIFKYLKKHYSCDTANYLLIIYSLVIPFSIFIVTTPQNLSYLFLILTLFYGLMCKNTIDLSIVYIFALASLAIHPLAGIPALLFVLLLHVYHSDLKKIKKYLYLSIFIVSSLVLPLLFLYLNSKSKLNATAIDKQRANISNFRLPEIIIPEKENFVLNAIYLYGFNLKYIIALLALVGIIIAYKNKKICHVYLVSFLMFLSSFMSYILLTKISFDYLIDYERSNYTNRALLISIIFLLPFIFSALYAFLYKILKQKLLIKIIFIIFMTLSVTISLYISYPRFDKYYNSHGYSTSQADIEAVKYIENNHSENYIVLANQQVSAGALRTFGFNRYLQGEVCPDLAERGLCEVKEIYFYPIPTGEELYNFYLEAVYEKPTKELMIKAMNFAGVNESYLVLNKYWWAFSKIVDEAKLEADSFTKIYDGEIIIFKYIR